MPSPVASTPKVSSAYISWLFASNRGVMAHLYTFTSASGVLDYFTDLDVDVVYGGNTYKSGSLRFEGLRRKIGIGTAVDEQTLKIWAAPADTLFGAAFLAGAESGLLDGAIIARARAIWAFSTGNAQVDIQAAPLAVWTLFTGYTAEITAGGVSHVELKVKSALHKLDTNMPRNYYQPGCNWTLFDAGCALNKASYGVTGTIGTGPTGNIIPVSGGISPINGPDGITYYAGGRLLFNSGVNAGLQVLVGANDGSNLYPAYLLNSVPAAGDSITYYPGCSKGHTTCDLKYSNSANFRGFDKVPPVMLSI